MSRTAEVELAEGRGIIGGGIGGIAIVIVVVIISYCTGGDLSPIINDTQFAGSVADLRLSGNTGRRRTGSICIRGFS